MLGYKSNIFTMYVCPRHRQAFIIFYVRNAFKHKNTISLFVCGGNSEGVLLVLSSFPFVFSPCIGCSESSDSVKFLYYAPFIAIFQIGWASTQVSHLALLPKMNPNELVRTELLAIR